MVTRFRDRHDAGRFLAGRLADYRGRPDVLVLALPRGGVPVGFEIAQALGVPLDVMLVRKLGVPGREELAMGAIAPGGVRVLNTDVLESLGIPPPVLEAVTLAEERELLRRQQLYRDDRPIPDLQGRTAILVDDGLATGATMQAAVAAVRAQHPGRLVVAVPTAAAQTCAAFAGVVDTIVCGITPEPFHAVGLWYDDFSETTDAEVRDLLGQAQQQSGMPRTGAGEPGHA